MIFSKRQGQVENNHPIAVMRLSMIHNVYFFKTLEPGRFKRFFRFLNAKSVLFHSKLDHLI